LGETSRSGQEDVNSGPLVKRQVLSVHQARSDRQLTSDQEKEGPDPLPSSIDVFKVYNEKWCEKLLEREK